MTAVLDAHAWTGPAFRITDRHEERVNAAALVLRHQLREDDGDVPVTRRIADVVLARIVVGGVDHELL